MNSKSKIYLDQLAKILVDETKSFRYFRILIARNYSEIRKLEFMGGERFPFSGMTNEEIEISIKESFSFDNFYSLRPEDLTFDAY